MPNGFYTGDNIPTKNPLRRLYDWVLSWANHPAGVWALFVLAVVESSIFPIPPDVLLIALAFAMPTKAFRYAFVCSLGSVLGGCLGYLIGYELWALTREFFFTYVFSEELFNEVGKLYSDNAFLAVLAAAFTPIPYKVFTIAAGVFKINFGIFVIASIIGRAGRFYVVAAIIRLFGEKAKVFIDKYFNWVALAFFVLIVLGFLALGKLL